MTNAILPGATLGVLGSGQLGRMFAIAARRLGYRVHVLSPDDDTPTGQVADLEVRADYLDLNRVAKFARGVSVVTFEFENVPAETTSICERFAPVRPAGSVLFTSQNRRREKTYLREAGLPVTPFISVESVEQLIAALHELGTPAVLKTADWGYDGKGQIVVRSVAEAPAAWLRAPTVLKTADWGRPLRQRTFWPAPAAQNTADWDHDEKGQVVIRSEAEAPAAWRELGMPQAILEAFIDFESELSVVAARGLNGDFASYGPIGNSHSHHILDVSVCPARVSSSIAREAVEIARAVLEQLDVIGVLCVEFFLTRDGRLLINETAPRPHNSGHLTIDAHVTCQFEQQVRAICGLPLGSSEQRSPSAMANLLGDLWEPSGAAASHEPNWPAVLSHPNVKLHLYGKREARPGRKMGHLTALANNVDEAERIARAARDVMVIL